MIQLDRHIEILLLDNDCVIVPDLGGFMAHHIEARFDDEDNMFLPPQRTLGFNPQLKLNDSLLAQSYVEAYDISYPEAIHRIGEEVSELKQHLETEGYYELNDIGRLSVNEEGKLEFEPCESGILTPSLYGLSTFEMKPLRQASPRKPRLLSKRRSGVKNEGSDSRTITIKTAWIRNTVAIAAALLAFLIMATPVSNTQPSDVNMSQVGLPLIAQDSNSQKAAIELNQQDIEQAIEAVKVEKTAQEPAPAFCIVLASQVPQRSAEEYVSKLQQQGIDARIFVRNNVRRVVCGAYATESEALLRLREIHRMEGLSEAWIYKMRK